MSSMTIFSVCRVTMKQPLSTGHAGGRPFQIQRWIRSSNAKGRKADIEGRSTPHRIEKVEQPNPVNTCRFVASSEAIYNGRPRVCSLRHAQAGLLSRHLALGKGGAATTSGIYRIAASSSLALALFQVCRQNAFWGTTRMLTRSFRRERSALDPLSPAAARPCIAHGKNRQGHQAQKSQN